MKTHHICSLQGEIWLTTTAHLRVSILGCYPLLLSDKQTFTKHLPCILKQSRAFNSVGFKHNNQVQQQVVQTLQFHPKITPETISEGQKSKFFLGDAPRPPQQACYACFTCIQCNLSITDTIGNQHFVHYSRVSLTQGLQLYNQQAWYYIFRLLSTTWLRFQSFTLLYDGREGQGEASTMTNNANLMSSCELQQQ